MASGRTRVCLAALVLLAAGTHACEGRAAEPEDPLAAAQQAAAEGESRRAIELATEALRDDEAPAEAYYLRGRERFRVGQIEESVEDFDRYVELRPRLASRQWERGIACYYAGKFREGAEQFELYQTYHDNDVENSVWRYLCMARFEGVEKARQAMLPIKNDPRVPMMEIYRLYRGDLRPDDVLAAVDRDSPTDEVRQGRLFYARLYLGLYYEVQGQPEKARKFILDAARRHRQTRGINRYMWDVARIHAERLASGDRPDSDKSSDPSK